MKIVLIFNIKEGLQPTSHAGEAHRRIRTLLMGHRNKQGRSRHTANFQDPNGRSEDSSSSGGSKAKRSSYAALY